MKADEKKIRQLLDKHTQVYIAENTGIAQSKISRIKRGNIKMKNITFEVASKLTELAEEINLKEENKMKNYEITNEAKNLNTQVETMGQAVDLYKEYGSDTIVWSIDKNEDLIDEVTELVAEYAEKGTVIK